MSKSYRVRVELYEATSEQYGKLHDAMKAKGLERTITSTNGRTYRLPPGEYFVNTDRTLQQVYEATKAVAETTGIGFEAFVSESGPWMSWRLKRVVNEKV